jgi:hypothetical protein
VYQRLKQGIAAAGYDGEPKKDAITHRVVADLVVDSHQVPHAPMLVLDCDQEHDVILGKWLWAHYDVALRPSDNSLIWPEKPPSTTRVGGTYRQEAKSNLGKMERALHDQERSPGAVIARGDMRVASINRFATLAQKELVYHTTLDDLDRMISIKRCEIGLPPEEEDVRARLPPQYAHFADVFSKKASDQLPPSRPFDHKIRLDPAREAELRHGPLYGQSLAELEATRDYVRENLEKGFIIPSEAPYSSPILFVKKANGGLRFCVDYRRLNATTIKDPYPIPRIDDTMRVITKAKIFSKLDIRQAFHRIRMEKESMDFTMFRTRQGVYKYQVLPFGLCNGPATWQRYMM